MLTANEARHISLTPEDKPTPVDEALMLGATYDMDVKLTLQIVELALKYVESAAKSRKRSFMDSWPLSFLDGKFTAGKYCNLPKVRQKRVKYMFLRKLKELGYSASMRQVVEAWGCSTSGDGFEQLEVTW